MSGRCHDKARLAVFGYGKAVAGGHTGALNSGRAGHGERAGNGDSALHADAGTLGSAYAEAAVALEGDAAIALDGGHIGGSEDTFAGHLYHEIAAVELYEYVGGGAGIQHRRVEQKHAVFILAGSGSSAFKNWIGTISCPLYWIGVVESIPTSSRQRM